MLVSWAASTKQKASPLYLPDATTGLSPLSFSAADVVRDAPVRVDSAEASPHGTVLFCATLRR